MSENSCCLVERGLIIPSVIALAHGVPKPTALHRDIANRHAHWATWYWERAQGKRVRQHERRPRGPVLCSGPMPTSCIPDHKAIILSSTGRMKTMELFEAQHEQYNQRPFRKRWTGHCWSLQRHWKARKSNDVFVNIWIALWEHIHRDLIKYISVSLDWFTGGMQEQRIYASYIKWRN